MNELRLQISNDAFYYFKYSAEPLDEENWEEIKELQKKFPFGVQVLDNWQAVENSDMIEATFIGLDSEPDNEAWDLQKDMFNGWRIMLRWLEQNETAHIAFWHSIKGLFGEQEVRILGNGKNDYFKTYSGGRFFLKHFKPCL